MLRMLAGYAASLATSSGAMVVLKGAPHLTYEFLAGVVLIFLVTIVPWLVCVLIGNTYSIRNPLYYAAWAVAPVTVIAGFSGDTKFILFGPTPLAGIAVVAGLVYWVIAGRFAGITRTRPLPDPKLPV
jgi:hypothetical protein